MRAVSLPARLLGRPLPLRPSTWAKSSFSSTLHTRARLPARTWACSGGASLSPPPPPSRRTIERRQPLHGLPPSKAPSPPKGTDKPVTMPFARLCNNTWLHDRSEKDVYRLLIDAYRMRLDDLYTFEGVFDPDSIYAYAADGRKGSLDSRKGFARFLDKAERTGGGILPPWWTAAKKAECIAMGIKGDEWQNLKHAVEKHDIQEHYGDPKFPMQLRMFTESIYGITPGGSRRDEMLAMQMKMEREDLTSIRIEDIEEFLRHVSGGSKEEAPK
ncbi:hypothetical protein QBC39DRAFT_350018 [Podospora conica]|nr:hypothetical protein QBC39DRAFT_350018 [Schizothecium conicum]